MSSRVTVDYTEEDVLKGLIAGCENRNSTFYHWYREYLIKDVVKTDRRHIYKVAYLYFEDFDIVEVLIRNESDFERALYKMHREKRDKLNSDCLKDGLTLVENLEDMVRTRLRDKIMYSMYWRLTMSYIAPSKSFKSSYITVTPSVFPGVLSGSRLYIFTKVKDLVRKDKEEILTWMNKVCEVVEEYVEESLPNIKYCNDYREDLKNITGFKVEEKYMEEENE